jgi:predicted nucleotidyltransferase component of viral defense system
MINLDEVRKISAQVSLSNTVVEKDYALGWLLRGIQKHASTNKSLVFKGGTCLKKCYFDTFRFSEDLDFSYLGSDTLSATGLTKIFREIAELIQDESGLEIPDKSIQFEFFSNPRGSESIQGSVKFRGPVRPQVGLNQMQRIKIDITLDEPLVLPPILKPVEHLYSDIPADGISALSYAYEEMFAEKVRALAQRLRPRDLYDVIHLFRRMDLNFNRSLIFSTLASKCSLRGIQAPTFEFLESHDNRQFLESEWEQQLKHQMPVLPSFNSFPDFGSPKQNIQ